ncbi:Metallo-dependent phosphatase-like protein [Phyllosticta citribraziliensis]|uniref:Metallo-dependent phosphatase-like protein n=1 Tax=Phyllosticta citribraziliensis TaxID=989973 RepID=A0ABR1M925_9PEZI
MQRLYSLFSFSRSPSFQILSDLHLEVGQQYSSFDIPASAPHLILAGDIGRLKDYDPYLEFLRRQTEQFETVFLVLGNHEFYGITFGEGLELARQLEQEPCLQHRLVLLHQRAHRIPGSSVTVLGCTLWSAIPDDARQAVAGAVSDFSKIQSWSIDQHNAAHGADVAWLKTQVESAASNDESLLVVTHHAPCIQLTSSPRHVGNPWTSAFATDLLGAAESGKAWDAIRVWVFGHTHYSTNFKVNGTRVVSNQRGYVLPGLVKKDGEGSGKHKFDVSRTIRI